jgi:hypothetical protein
LSLCVGAPRDRSHATGSVARPLPLVGSVLIWLAHVKYASRVCVVLMEFVSARSTVYLTYFVWYTVTQAHFGHAHTGTHTIHHTVCIQRPRPPTTPLPLCTYLPISLHLSVYTQPLSWLTNNNVHKFMGCTIRCFQVLGGPHPPRARPDACPCHHLSLLRLHRVRVRGLERGGGPRKPAAGTPG